MSLQLISRSRAAAAAVILSGLSAAHGGPALSPAAQEVADRARTKVVVLKTRRGGKQGSGTGFLALPNLVVTADHVVRDTTGITAWLNGVSYGARVVESHPAHDLALLRLHAPLLSLKPADLAPDSAGLVAAEELLILAGPSQGHRADGEPAHRVAIPAAFHVRRPLTDPAGRSDILLSMRASVRKGDSGSPVFRVRDARVIGVLSSREQPDAGGVSRFAYAVPVEAVHRWLDEALRRDRDREFYLFRDPEFGGRR